MAGNGIDNGEHLNESEEGIHFGKDEDGLDGYEAKRCAVLYFSWKMGYEISHIHLVLAL